MNLWKRQILRYSDTAESKTEKNNGSGMLLSGSVYILPVWVNGDRRDRHTQRQRDREGGRKRKAWKEWDSQERLGD